MSRQTIKMCIMQSLPALCI